MNKKGIWGFVMCWIVVAIILCGIVLICLSLNLEEHNKCSKICKRKGLDFYSLSTLDRGRYWVSMCSCLDKNGDIQEFER